MNLSCESALPASGGRRTPLSSERIQCPEAYVNHVTSLLIYYPSPNSVQTILFYYFILFYFVFLVLHPFHMDVPRLGVKYGARAACLCHSHGNMGSKPCLRPTPQLTAMLDP